jgi:hypothetical protein
MRRAEMCAIAQLTVQRVGGSRRKRWLRQAARRFPGRLRYAAWRRGRRAGARPKISIAAPVTFPPRGREKKGLAGNTVCYGEKQPVAQGARLYVWNQNPPRFFLVREARIRPGFFLYEGGGREGNDHFIWRAGKQET